MWKLVFFRGKYYAYTKIEGKSIRRSLRTSDESLADSRFEDFIRNQKRPSTTLEDIFQEYMDEKNNPTLQYRWKVLAPHFKNLLPDQINTDVCKRYETIRLKTGKKPSTIATELALLRAAIRFNDRNTKAVFYIPSASPPRDRYLTKEEAQRLIRAAIEPHVKLFIILGITTASRKSAILNLKWDQVDLERGLINFGNNNKNKRKAVVPINNTLERALEEAYNARTTDYVIEYGSKPIKDIKRGFAASVTRAGLDNVSPHTLRHTSAVWMAEDRTPMSEISQYLGHKNTLITESVYARYSPEYLRKPASSLELLD